MKLPIRLAALVGSGLPRPVEEAPHLERRGRTAPSPSAKPQAPTAPPATPLPPENAEDDPL